jgi:hypothetical protein
MFETQIIDEILYICRVVCAPARCDKDKQVFISKSNPFQMANSDKSNWHEVSGTIYYIAGILSLLVPVLVKYYPAQTPLSPPLTCKAIEVALNQWVNHAGGSVDAMQYFTPKTKAHIQLSDNSLMDEGLLSDYLQKLRIQPIPLQLQTCEWDSTRQHIQLLIFKSN